MQARCEALHPYVKKSPVRAAQTGEVLSGDRVATPPASLVESAVIAGENGRDRKFDQPFDIDHCLAQRRIETLPLGLC